MNKKLQNEWIENLYEAITNNSYLEAEDDDTILFYNVKSIRKYDNEPQLVVHLTNGSKIYITVETSEKSK